MVRQWHFWVTTTTSRFKWVDRAALSISTQSSLSQISLITRKLGVSLSLEHVNNWLDPCQFTYTLATVSTLLRCSKTRLNARSRTMVRSIRSSLLGPKPSLAQILRLISSSRSFSTPSWAWWSLSELEHEETLSIQLVGQLCKICKSGLASSQLFRI